VNTSLSKDEQSLSVLEIFPSPETPSHGSETLELLLDPPFQVLLFRTTPLENPSPIRTLPPDYRNGDSPLSPSYDPLTSDVFFDSNLSSTPTLSAHFFLRGFFLQFIDRFFSFSFINSELDFALYGVPLYVSPGAGNCRLFSSYYCRASVPVTCLSKARDTPIFPPALPFGYLFFSPAKSTAPREGAGDFSWRRHAFSGYPNRQELSLSP